MFALVIKLKIKKLLGCVILNIEHIKLRWHKYYVWMSQEVITLVSAFQRFIIKFIRLEVNRYSYLYFFLNIEIAKYKINT